MNDNSRKIRNVYLLLTTLHTLAASFIWGINTLFLLDSGLNMTEAFAANAFYTAGFMLFEVPTGVVADARGRRTSYLLGTLTLIASTFVYLLLWRIDGPFWAWALASVFIGLGFTFFSGAVDAWLVDALTDAGFFKDGGELEAVLAKGQIVQGVAMLVGSVGGGAIAEATNLGVPYIVRGIVLALSFIVAFAVMHDQGFKPSGGKRIVDEVRTILRGSIKHGLANPPVRWVMLAGIFTGAILTYAFYAMQPFLLELYGNEQAYFIAGLAAAIFAGAQIAGGLFVQQLHHVFRKRTTVLVMSALLSAVALALIGLFPVFWIAIAMLALWGFMFSAVTPIRQAYLNELIPSAQRATVLSFDSLLGSTGAVVGQPLLGRAADALGYPASYLCSAAIQICAIPFFWIARRENATSDVFEEHPNAISSE